MARFNETGNVIARCPGCDGALSTFVKVHQRDLKIHVSQVRWFFIPEITLQQATLWALNHVGGPPDVYARPHIKLDVFPFLEADAQGYVSHLCGMTDSSFRLPVGCPVLVLAFDVQHAGMGPFHPDVDSLSVQPRIACEGPAAIRAALKEHIAMLRRQGAMKLREALKLEKVADEAFEIEWPGYWEQQQASRLYYVK